MTGDHVVDVNGDILSEHDQVYEVDCDNVGTVTRITDLDADFDYDLGRYVGWNPKVFVKFGEDEPAEYDTYDQRTGPWDDGLPYKCEDLALAKKGGA